MSSNKKQVHIKKIKKPVRSSATYTPPSPVVFPDQNEIVFSKKETFPPAPPARASLSQMTLDRGIDTRNTKSNSTVPSYSTALYMNPNQVTLSDTNVLNEMEKIEDTLKREKEEFEREQRQRQEAFEREQSKKYAYLKKELSKFEEEYNPYEIMSLYPDTITLKELRRKYKTLILKYHPDKVGDQYKGKFQIITQAYLYLLNKLEKEEEIKEKTTRKVKMERYDDKRNEIEEEALENIYIDKDNFNIDSFNKIFEKYRLPSEYDDGYNNLGFDDTQKNTKEDNVLFGKKFNQEIFHSHFDKIKNKKSTDLMEYHEPQERFSSEHLAFQELGSTRPNDFGSMNSMNGLSYTDYKKAHLDENLLIDAQKVKYKSYKNVNQLEAERSNITFQASEEEKRNYMRMQQEKEEREQKRHQQLIERDEQIRHQYQQLNKKLIVR